MTTKERLLLFLKHLGVGQSAFERQVGISNGYISSIKESIGSGHVQKIASKFPELNTEWLLTGNGEMLKSDNRNEPYLITSTGIKYYKIKDDLYRMVVPFVPIKAYAKYIDEYRDAEESEYEHFEFPVKEIHHGNYKAFEIKGDSMDNDTRKSIGNGDIVLARELSKEHWKSPLHINDYANWILILGNTIICKQIIGHNTETGEIICHSLNQDPAYADFSINLSDVYQLFNIVQKTTFII